MMSARNPTGVRSRIPLYQCVRSTRPDPDLVLTHYVRKQKTNPPTAGAKSQKSATSPRPRLTTKTAAELTNQIKPRIFTHFQVTHARSATRQCPELACDWCHESMRKHEQNERHRGRKSPREHVRHAGQSVRLRDRRRPRQVAPARGDDAGRPTSATASPSAVRAAANGTKAAVAASESRFPG